MSTNAQMKPQEAAMTFSLPSLPYAPTALEPHISAKTFEFHHGKHHKAYVDKANELVKGTALEGMPLEQAVIESRKQGVGPLFNNIGQIYNHNMFWESMAPNGGGMPPVPFLDLLVKSFGSLETFKEQFVNAGIGQFGSGWVWLVAAPEGKLEIVKTANAETPLTEGKAPLLVCDVWEHAYYIDYQNRRADFLKVFVEKLANWQFALSNWKKANGMTGGCGGHCGCKG